MQGPINIKSPNNTSKWQMGFNSAFKGLMHDERSLRKFIILFNMNFVCGMWYMGLMQNEAACYRFDPESRLPWDLRVLFKTHIHLFYIGSHRQVNVRSFHSVNSCLGPSA